MTSEFDYFRVTLKGQTHYYLYTSQFNETEQTLFQYLFDVVDCDKGYTCIFNIKLLLEHCIKKNNENKEKYTALLNSLQDIVDDFFEKDYIEINSNENEGDDGEKVELRFENVPLSSPFSGVYYKFTMLEYLRQEYITKIGPLKRSEIFSKTCDFCDCKLPFSHITLECKECKKTYDECYECATHEKCFRHYREIPFRETIELGEGKKKIVYHYDVGELMSYGDL